MDAIEAIETDTGISMPDDQAIEFLEASRAGDVTHEQLCEYMDKQISKAVLGQTASTEGTPGKLGNEQNQENVRQEIIEADADLLDGCLNENLIKWIVDYNFPNVTAYPKIITYAAAKPDLTGRSAIDKSLVVDIGLPVAVDYFYETYGIPAPQEGEILVIPAKPSAFRLPGQNNLPQFAESTEKNTLDIIAEMVSKESLPLTDAFVDDLKHLVATAASMEDLKGRIIDLYSKLDPAQLGAVIARGMLLAEAAGRYDVRMER
jgi:phage gp29-like protein